MGMEKQQQSMDVCVNGNREGVRTNHMYIGMVLTINGLVYSAVAVEASLRARPLQRYLGSPW